jgi:putative ABC transport system permease protein
MDTLLQDIRYAARKLVRTPGFAVIALLTLALAIGANTAIFSVVYGVALKPLPFRQPDQLIRLTGVRKNGRMPLSPLDYLDYKAQAKSLSSVFAYTDFDANLTGGPEPERLRGDAVSASFWSTLGVPPALGRGFTPNEDDTSAPKVMVISDALWRRRFGADPRVIGRVVMLDGAPTTIVGVAPQNFNYPDKPDVWTPLTFAPIYLQADNRGAHYLGAVGRVAPGISVAQADQEVRGIAQRLEKLYPESNTGMAGAAIPLQKYMVGNDLQQKLYVLLAAVGFVLLIACANVANLLLVRASGREAEIAVRSALGAGRWRIVRQLVIESIVLSLVGGALGALLAVWGVDLLVSLGPSSVPRLSEVTVDGRVLGFTASIAIATGLLFGIVPALHAARSDVGGVLKDGARSVGARRGAGRLRGMLVLGVMAMAVVLLIGAGLLVRSFDRLLAVDPGFRAERVMTFSITATSTKYGKQADLRTLTTAVIDRMKAVPGVQSVSIVDYLPMSGSFSRTSVHLDGTPPDPPGERKITSIHLVAPDYFATMGIPLIRGRDFSTVDRSGAPIAVIVNEEFVRRYFDGQDAIGKRVTTGFGTDTSDGPGGEIEVGGPIVGIVKNVKADGLTSDVLPQTYFAAEQTTTSQFSVLLRTTASPTTVATAVRRQMRALDPDLPLYGLRQLSEVVSQSVSQPRFYTILLSLFAGIALTLAAVGIYGVISYAVSQRTRELGIRIALGASAREVVRHVLAQGLVLTLGGLAVGLTAAVWASRALSSFLFGIEPLDMTTYFAVAVVLSAVAVIACLVPARRASRVDPMVAIRAE